MDKLIDGKLILRKAEERDLFHLWELIFKEEHPEWKEWDAPYFPHTALSYDEFLMQKYRYLDQDRFFVVELGGRIIGIVSSYFEDEMKKWLEVGIVLHNAKERYQGVGTKCLKLWITHMFETYDVARVGLTTWSGNTPMIRVAEKLNMQMEGRMRKVRYWNGEYYDSIRMGVLREEWLEFCDRD